MSTLAGISVCLFGNLLFTLAPIPREATPDPMARGYMGITVQTGALMIESVQPGLPAEKSGLRAGDVLLRVGTLEPREFEQVVSHICSFRPGAVVEIEVQRGGTRKTFQVKLASRPADLDRVRNPYRPVEIDD